MAGVLEESVKHTVGVSKDLREGVRLSIEIIANEVVRRRAAQGLCRCRRIEAQPLAKQSLRFLYRILFLLYAEASPELGVLPSARRSTSRATASTGCANSSSSSWPRRTREAGTHLYESLACCSGWSTAATTPLTDGTAAPTTRHRDSTFNALRADLFRPQATALIDEVGLGNEATPAGARAPAASKESKGRKGSTAASSPTPSSASTSSARCTRA